MDRRAFVAWAGGAWLGMPGRGFAQTAAPVRRIGLVSGFLRSDTDFFVGLLRPELDKLGWTEGRNILLDVRTSDGRNEMLPQMAMDVVAQRPDLVLIQSVPAARAAMRATDTLPIVMIGIGNPVETGIVANLGRPGGNVTGSSYLADESILKTLELLREAAPAVRSVALFVNSSNDAAAPMAAKFRSDAAAHGMRAQVVEVAAPSDFERAFASIRRENTGSLVVPPEALTRGHRDAIGQFARTHALPMAIVGSSYYHTAGCLLTYGPTSVQYAALTARYVDRLLRGAKPGDLPVEQPSRFELAIDLKTAEAIGLTVPASLLQRADRVIR